MKVASTLLALALGAQASLYQRDAAGIQKVLNDISEQVKGLDTAVNSFSGDTKGLLDAGTKLLSTIKSGTTTVSSSDQLDILAASQVSQSVTGLNSSVATVCNDLIAKKSAILSAGAGGLVLQSLTEQKTASGALSEAITSKVPVSLQTVSRQLSQGVDDSLTSAIAAYKDAGSAPASPSAPASTAHSGGGQNATSPTPKPSASPSAVVPAKPSSAAPSSAKPATASSGALANRVSGALAALAAVMAF